MINIPYMDSMGHEGICIIEGCCSPTELQMVKRMSTSTISPKHMGMTSMIYLYIWVVLQTLNSFAI